LDRLKTEADFANISLDKVLQPIRYVGRAPEQVDEFVQAVVEPIRQRYHGQLGKRVELQV